MALIIFLLVGIGQDIALMLAVLWLYRRVYPYEHITSSRASALVLGGLVGGLGLLGLSVPTAIAPEVSLDGRMLLVVLASAWAGPIAGIVAAALASLHRLWIDDPALLINTACLFLGAALGTLAWGRWGQRRPVVHPLALAALGLGSAALSLAGAMSLPAPRAEVVLSTGGVALLLAYPPAALILGAIFAQDQRHAEAEAALARSEARYRMLAQNFPNGAVLLYDRDLRFTLTEGDWLNSIGLSRAEIEGRLIWDIFSPEVCQMIEPPLRAALGGTPTVADIRFRDGIYRMHTLPLPGADGRITTGMAMTQDITADRRAALALKESEERYARLVDAAFEGIGLSENGIIVDVNERLSRMLGYARDELIGMPAEQVVAPESRALVRQHIRSGYQGSYEHLALCKDGSRIPVEVQARTAQHQGREIRVTAIRDMSQRRAAEQALLRSERMFKDLVQSINAAVWELDAQTFQLTVVSEQVEQLLGYPAAAWLASPTFWSDHIHPDDRERSSEHCLRSAQALGQREFEYRMIAADGREVWLRDTVALEALDGRPWRLRGVMVDITDRKRTEEQLRLVQTAALLIGTARDLPTALGVVLREVCQATGWALGQAWVPQPSGAGLVCCAVWPSEQPSMDVFRRVSAALALPPGVGMPGRVWQDRQALWIQDVASATNFPRSPAARASGIRAGAAFPVLVGPEVVAVLEFFVCEQRAEDERMVTLVTSVAAQLGAVIERKRAESALRESEERYRRIVETAEEGIWMIDGDGVTTFVNPKLASWLGYAVDDLIGMPMLAFMDADERPRVAHWLARRGQEAPEQYDLCLRRSDGARVWGLVSATPITDARGRYMGALVMITDITARRQAELALQESEARFRAMFERAAIGIALVDTAGRVVAANLAFQALLGYSAAELSGLTYIDITHPDDAATDVQLFLELIAGTRESYRLEKRYLRRDDQVAWGHLTVSLVRTAQGAPHFAISMVEDISERKRIEAQYLQSQRLDAIGRLAGGVAHDFNNLLTVILSCGELLLDEIGPEHPLCHDVLAIQDAAQRAASLTRQLLVFSSQRALQPDIVNLNTVVTSVEKLLRRLIGEDITLIITLASDLGTVQVDAGQIEQVLMNLAINARDAMPRGGTLIIETANVVLDAPGPHAHGELAAGPYVLLAISDTGCGMDAQTQAHIFEPFFTTKGPGKGTGLGLSTVYGIVRQSGGSIWVSSEVDCGTTFKIYLPQMSAASVARPPLPSLALAGEADGAILLVEDEPLVRELAGRVLRGCGYVVLEAADGPTALRLAAEQAAPIDLLLTDVIMPGGMSGPEVAERLLAQQPGLRVLYMSGYTDSALAHHTLLRPSQDVIQKPFTPAGLMRAVWQVLRAHDQALVGGAGYPADN